MSRKQVWVYFHASYYYKIHQMHDLYIFPLKIGIPDKNNLFATLPTHIHKIKHVKPNLSGQIYHSKPSKPSLPNYTYETNFTKKTYKTKPIRPNLPKKTIIPKEQKQSAKIKFMSQMANLIVNQSQTILSLPWACFVRSFILHYKHWTNSYDIQEFW